MFKLLSVFLNHRTQKLDKTMWSVFLDQRNSTRIAGNLSRFGGQRGIGFPRRGAGMGQDWVGSIGRPAIRLWREVERRERIIQPLTQRTRYRTCRTEWLW